MKKSEIDILTNIEKINESNTLLNQFPKTPQQHFMLTYAAIYFISKGSPLSILQSILKNKNGSFSYLQLKLKYMKQCMQSKYNLQNNDFNVLNTLVLWMEGLQDLTKNTSPRLTSSILVPHPQKLKFEFYQQYIVYLNYIAIDIQNLFKTHGNKWQADDIIQLLLISLPRIHYNIILSKQLLGEEEHIKKQPKDILFWNLSLQYYTRTKTYYRSLCKQLIKLLINLPLKSNQMRQMIDAVCRYYLLFWNDSRQNPIDIFISAFQKITEAVRFSLTDELLLFFRICQKLGENHIQQLVRQKWQWIDLLLKKFTGNSIGHPKDDVYPYNLLQIKQKVTVQAGKTSSKILQIYHQYSLFYISVGVEDLDVTIKLYYLGDFQSNVQVKQLLLTEQKKTELNRFAFMATKKGIYKIELDNSYSWINSKKIQYQYVILTQYSNNNHPIWLNNLLESNVNNFNKQKFEMKQKEKKVALKIIKETKKIEDKSGTPKNQSQQIQQYAQIELCYSDSNVQQQKKNQNQNDKIKDKKPLFAIQNTINKQKLEEKNIIEPPLQKQKLNSTNKQKQIEKQEITESKIQQTRHQQSKEIKVITEITEIKSSPSIPLIIQNKEVNGQANLSLIDQIFSLLVSTADHTYEFQTNFEDKIIKRLKSYSQQQKQYQWTVNKEARDWLKKQGFSLLSKNGVLTLSWDENNLSQIKKEIQNLQRQ